MYNEINEKDADYFSILRQKLAQNHPDTVGIFDRLSLKGEASYAQVSEEAVLADLQKIIENKIMKQPAAKKYNKILWYAFSL